MEIVLLDLEKLRNLDNCLLKGAINAGFLKQISLSLESMNWHLKSGQTCLCDERASGFLSWKPVLLPFIKYYFITMFPLNKFKRLNCLVEASLFSDFFFKKDTFLLVDVMYATCKGKTVNRHKIRLLFNVQPLTNTWVELLSLTRVFMHMLTKKTTKKMQNNRKKNQNKKKSQIKAKKIKNKGKKLTEKANPVWVI